MAGFLDLARDVLTTGINAAAEVQTARYQANDPTPQNRGTSNVSAPAGSPAFQTIADTFSDPRNLLLLGVAAVLVIVLVKRL